VREIKLRVSISQGKAGTVCGRVVDPHSWRMDSIGDQPPATAGGSDTLFATHRVML